MKLPGRIIVQCQTGCAKALASGLIAFSCAAAAQQVFLPAPVPRPPTSALATPEVGTNNASLATSADTADALAAAPAPSTQPFALGPVTARPHLLYRFLYGNGAQLTPGHPLTTALHEIAPGILFDIGQHWSLDYTPTLSYYSNPQFRDNLGHAAALTGNVAREDWSLSLSQRYLSESTLLVETASQTDQETYTTALGAHGSLANQISVDLAVNQIFRFAENFTTAREWSSLNWLNYEFAKRLDASIGVGGGYVNVEPGPNQAYEQLQGRVRWHAGEKTSFEAHCGGEDRQFLDSTTADLLNPVFGASVQYQPFEPTSLTLNANRIVAVSYLQSQVTETTEFRGELTQRLFKRLYLNLGGGYYSVNYVPSASSIAEGRDDNYYALDVRLYCFVLKRGALATFFRRTENSSNQPGFTFTSNQVGVEVGYRY